MSKYELQAEALQASGISVQQSQEAVNLSPSIYDRLGVEGFHELSSLFYNRVFDDDDPRFQSIFSSSTKLEAIENQVRQCSVLFCVTNVTGSMQCCCFEMEKETDNSFHDTVHSIRVQYRFLVQTFGGPDLYR